MCRVIGYIGETITLDKLMLLPDNSLVNQSFDAEEHASLQMAGFGMSVWKKDAANSTFPLMFKGIKPPFYDPNLTSICQRSETNVMLGHIRATSNDYLDFSGAVNEHNCHPFIFPDCQVALAHNGGLADYGVVRLPLLNHCNPHLVKHIQGNTDSEVIYALFLSQLEDYKGNITAAEMNFALQRTMKILLDVMTKYNVNKASKLKLFLADSDTLLVANLGIGENRNLDVEGDWEQLRKAVPDVNFHAGEEDRYINEGDYNKAQFLQPLWALKGKDYASSENFDMTQTADEEVNSIVVASEPLTISHDNWSQIPIQHISYFDYNNGNPIKATEKFNFI
jgi:glutamine amidotransferase